MPVPRMPCDAQILAQIRHVRVQLSHPQHRGPKLADRYPGLGFSAADTATCP